MVHPESVFRSAFDQSTLPLAVVDARGVLALWNGAFEVFFRSLAEVGPDRLRGSLFEFLAERECNRFDFYAADILLGGRKSAVLESPIRAAGGVRRWCRFSISFLEPETTAARPDAPTGGGSAERFLLLSIEDITDRVFREKSLQDAKDEAEKATHTKSQFLANMSHEIRTPIQTILGVVELLQDTALDGEQAEYAAQVRFSAEVLLGLINDILDFSKIEAGKLDLEATDLNLRDCVRQSVDMLVMEAHRKGLEVIVDIDDRLPTAIRGDPVRIRQIIVNLFKNAVKFTREGSISLVVRLRDGGAKPHARFEVADTGIGIPEQVRERLFTPFFQADFAAARKAGGTGLGLAISRHLVDLMGGFIGVSPNEGSGSIFWFELPLSVPEHSATPHRQASGGGARLLVVDDYRLSREFAQGVAEKAGYRVAEATSGEEALEALKRAAEAGDPFALCLIDQNMPRMDGWRLASEITGNTAINSARLVLMVPEGTMGGEAKMKLLRWFDAYVPKPIRPPELLEALVRALSKEVDLPPAESAQSESIPEMESVYEADVLIAEDHEVNRELFTVILSRLGCKVVTARDGAEAAEIGASRHFDIVLMDIFMPRMNGYEATKALREKGLRAPIVAVTASALKGEREKCIAAGMDDILVKPFKKKDIAGILERWLPESKGGRREGFERTKAVGPMIASAGATVSAADIARKGAESRLAGERAKTSDAYSEDPMVFDWTGVLDTFLGQEATVISLLGRFDAKAKAQVEEMAATLASGELGKFREIAHSMKGASWNLSARNLGDAALAAETAGKEGDRVAAALAYERVRIAYQEFSVAARRRQV